MFLELGDAQGIPKPNKSSKKSKKFQKAVSFGSSTSTTYYTPSGNKSYHSNDVLSDTASWKTAAQGYDTDYFSPDEDEEVFFDIPTSDEDLL